jgi:hypothetical protein
MKKQNFKVLKSTKAERIDADLPVPVLTPAEMAEVERFKLMATQRAIKQATIHRLIARLEDRDALADAA